MADLNINKLENSALHEDVGQNPVSNGNFEIVPSFVAATTTSSVFINGTAAGSSTDSSSYWALLVNATAFQAQFDTSVFHSGTASLKLSATNTTGRGTVRLGSNAIFGSITAQLMEALTIPVKASTTYTISAWIKTNNAASGAVNGQWTRFTSSYTAIGSNFTLFGTNNGTQDWTLKSTTVTTGSTDAYMQLVLNNNTAGNISDAWFDDIVLTCSSQNNVMVDMNPIVTPGIQNVSGPKVWS